MPDKPCYDITLEDQDIIVRFNRNIIDPDRVARFLDYLELEAIRKYSQLTEESAATLAEEIDREVWSNVKSKFSV